MKLPEQVAELDFYFDENGVSLTFTPKWYGMLEIGKHSLYTESQLREALRQQRAVMRQAWTAIVQTVGNGGNETQKAALKALEDALK